MEQFISWFSTVDSLHSPHAGRLTFTLQDQHTCSLLLSEPFSILMRFCSQRPHSTSRLLEKEVFSEDFFGGGNCSSKTCILTVLQYSALLTPKFWGWFFLIKMLYENAVLALGFLSLKCACKSEILAIAPACLLYRHALNTCTPIQQVCYSCCIC